MDGSEYNNVRETMEMEKYRQSRSFVIADKVSSLRPQSVLRNINKEAKKQTNTNQGRTAHAEPC